MTIKPIFCSAVDHRTGGPAGHSPKYNGRITHWPDGYTMARGALQEGRDAYDGKTGQPDREVIYEKFKPFNPGAIISIDIEELGYNGLASTAGETQIKFIQACQETHPDKRFGYYDCLGNMSQLNFTEDGESRQNRERTWQEYWKLFTHCHFIAPQLYVDYEGPIRGIDGTPAEGLTAGVANKWPPGSRYSFKDWESHAIWLIGWCRQFGLPVYPYFSPYVINSGNHGGWEKPRKDPDTQEWDGFKFPVSDYRKRVATILDHADGMFHYDLASKVWPQWFEDEIVETIMANNSRVEEWNREVEVVEPEPVQVSNDF